MNPITKILSALLIMGLIPSVFGAYTASYSVSDLDDVMIDLIATAGSQVREDVPTLVDLGILYLIFVLISMALTAMAIAIMVIPKKLAPKGGKF